FVKVELNGVVVQDNVEVTGPTRSAAFTDEMPMGPLMLQGDHGPVAFRNIRYKLIGQNRVTLADLKYELRNGVFKSTEDYANLRPVKTGMEDGLQWNAGGVPDTFALTHTGTITIPASGEYLFSLGLDWIGDDPHFTGQIVGGADLIIGGKEALHHSGKSWMESQTVHLDEGTYPFTLTYFKNRAWTEPSMRLEVEGPTVAAQILNAPGTFLEPDVVDHILVRPENRTRLQRSFVKHYGREFVDAVNVGEPSGVNYTLDLSSDALLYVWKGGFIDATNMWHSRGNEQIAIPLGSVVNVSAAPSVAVLPSRNAPWPDSISGTYPLKGYRLDPDGRPTFLFSINGLHVADKITPGGDGRTLTRHLAVQGTSQDDLWVRLAVGDEITPRQDGLYDVEGRYYVQVPGSEAAMLRTQGGRQELLLPVKLSSGQAEVDYTLIW
ncbi:MAG TPA: family 16 glycoside hydrolase, partial [Rhodothermales bacterium]|nr:family 16 glycoside hydrolase [Rhodothermales bacterium]